MDSAILPRLTGLQKTLPKPSSAVAILSAVKTLFFAAIQNSVLFGIGSDDRPMLSQFRSADVLSGRHFVRTALDVLSGRRFVRTSLDVLSGRRFVRTDLCDIFFRRTSLDVLSGRRFVRTALDFFSGYICQQHPGHFLSLLVIFGTSWHFLVMSGTLGYFWYFFVVSDDFFVLLIFSVVLSGKF